MRSYVAAGAVIAASISAAVAEPGAQEIGGNWYANLVQKISYTGLGSAGQYQKVTDMSNGQCSYTPQSYSGNLSPLDEEVSRSPATTTGRTGWMDNPLTCRTGLHSLPRPDEPQAGRRLLPQR